jgi:hypothetical protein
MVAFEEDGRSRAALKLEQIIDYRARAWAAIDIIPDEYYGIAALGRDRVEHHGQLIHTSVDIADRKQPAVA